MVRVETIKKCFCWSTYWPTACAVATADVLGAQVTVQHIPTLGHQLKPLQLSRRLQGAGGVSKKTEGMTGNIWGSESPHTSPGICGCSLCCASTVPRTPLGLVRQQLCCRAWTRPSTSCYLEASNLTLALNSLLLTGKHACSQKKKRLNLCEEENRKTVCVLVFWVACLLLGVRAGFAQDSSQSKFLKGEGEINEKLHCSTQVNNFPSIK